MNLEHSLWLILPETILTITVVAIILTGLILPQRKQNQTGWLAATGLLGAFLLTLLLYQQGTDVAFFKKMVVHDWWSLYFKLFFEITGFLIVVTSLVSKEANRKNQSEYYGLVLSVVVGLMFMASSLDLVMILISMELVGILSYILVGFLKTEARGSEASLKYLIYGATATGFMVFGMSYLYGLTGSTNLLVIADQIAAQTQGYPLLIVLLFILVGMGFKIAMVPFHMWCPDVYEGAPTPITAFLSVGPKAAGFALIIRFIFTLFTKSGDGGAFILVTGINWPLLIAILSAFTMTIGNLSALTQTNVKRLLAYSSIAHAGYALMGLVVVNTLGLKAVLFYLTVYLFMNVGAFLVVIAIRDAIGSEEIADYKGIGRMMPFLPVTLAIFLFSLTGLPPFSGFIGKFYLFMAVINEGLFWLVTVAIINTVISLYYYARIVKAMFLEESSDRTILAIKPLHVIVATITVVPTLVLGVYWGPLLQFAEQSISMLR